MIEANVKRVLDAISPGDVVLDVGGWACPFNRANFVLDSSPFHSRGFYSTFGGPKSQGGDVEHFSEATWIQRDMCDRAPYPFADKSVDFVICSQTLEDVRDPLWVCSEMIRIGKRGYIEVPSRKAESSRGWEHPRLAGLSHHRWLVDVEGDQLTFQMKYHLINSHWRFSLPRSFLMSLLDEEKIEYVFWENSFSFSERIVHGQEQMAAELECFVKAVRPYPAWMLATDAWLRNLVGLGRRAASKLKRPLGRRNR